MKWILTMAALLAATLLRAQEPDLPPGLGEPQQQQQQPDEPGLPPGLEPTTAPEPELPTTGAPREPWQVPFGLTGFWETRAGARTQRDPYERTTSIAESRLRLELDRQVDRFVFKAKADLLADTLAGSWQPDLERGRGFVDLREASAAVSPLAWLDVKVGRQVLTWGTGDLLFVNDLFPKDWVSFFVGRDDEYLKAPSDALRVGVFTDVVNFDLIYTPRFDPDRFLTGERVSYYNPNLGRRSGRDAIQDPDVPDQWFDDAEFAARVYKNVEGVEFAGYLYSGRWKSPGGFDPVQLRATFPRLDVYGLSARGQLAGGIANLELGWYDSRQDRGGGDALVDNSQLRVLAGYERDVPELAESLTIGVQYYLEAMLQHDDYLASLPGGVPARDELRHVVTLRVTRLLLDQRLRLSLFGYFSPSDHDLYLRPNASYTIDDSWSVTIGGNVFAGEQNDTFFGQFGPNTNVFAAVRFSF
ncbi:MAG: hypothetical protein R3F29_10520 [Planctomycetota bacterium]